MAACTDLLSPSEALVASMTLTPMLAAYTIASATRSGLSMASSPALMGMYRHSGHMPTFSKPLLPSPTACADSPSKWW